MKSRKIINIILVACIAVGIVFIIKFDVFGKIENRINEEKIRNETLNKAEEAFADEPETKTETLTDKEGAEGGSKVVKVLYPKEGETEEELMYETLTDKDGNEIVVEYKKEVLVDSETGEEVEFWKDTAEQINIFYYKYEGTIEKIEDNKIYFMVDREAEGRGVYSLKNVEDYEIVFDINTFNLESDPSVLYSVNDFLSYEDDRFFKASDLNFLIGKRVKVHFSEYKDPHILETYKTIDIFNR